MLPQLPAAFNPEFASEFSQSGAATCSTASDIDHHCQICPTCGYKLQGHRCKLVCVQCECGYYLSCADYY